jgi:putative transposase
MGHTYSDILLHIVFSTKERRPLLDAELKLRLLPYLNGITGEFGARLLTANGPADHVHLLALVPPALAPAGLVRAVKGGSSRWVHETWPERSAFAWQDGYGVFSVGHRSMPDIERYIADQEQHHRRTTFQDEFRNLLKQHGILFDERYIWG